MSKKIKYPSASSLDTSGWGATSGYRVQLYLIPREETTHGRPEVVIHAGLGNIGWPMPAFNHLWVGVGHYGGGVVGASVLDALREREDLLLALSDTYIGAEWNGNNMVGRWEEAPDWEFQSLDFDVDELRSYWDAFDWFGPACIGWEGLCSEAGVDPELGLGDDWENVACEVAATVEPMQDEEVSGTEEYALRMAQEYRELLSNTVLLQTMPDHLRASHRAAGNWGFYPHNGAVRVRMAPTDALMGVWDDPDGYATIVPGSYFGAPS